MCKFIKNIPVSIVGLSLFLTIVSSNAQVTINELMYHPPGTNLTEQWLELYNPTTQAIDLSNWQLDGDVRYTFSPGTTLGANSYLVVTANKQAFSQKYTSVTNFVGDWSGFLKHHVRLLNAIGKIIYTVDFYNEGDWAIRRLGPMDFNHQGWEWYAEHDGYGASLELINPQMPPNYSHNWSSSSRPGGTPGTTNSVFSENIAPFIIDVKHLPVIPRSTDRVTVTAKIIDDHNAVSNVFLFWRIDGLPQFTQEQMFDDGRHNDLNANDGIFGAILPELPNSSIVEFYIVAHDTSGNSRKYPEFIQPTNSTRTANLLFQVDNSVDKDNTTVPVFRIIMRENERNELYNLGRNFPDADSNARMNATFIVVDNVVSRGQTTQIRYLCGVRNRGHGTRTLNPNNYHVCIPNDRKWNGQSGINFNSNYAQSQVIGSAIFRILGIPIPDSRLAHVRVNSTNLMELVSNNSYGYYAANEQYNDDFVKHAWPNDPDGNLYRGIRQPTMSSPNLPADLDWHGTNFFIGSYTNLYFKQNNFIQNDYSDLIKLLGVLNVTNGTTPETYVKDVTRILNVDEWMQYMAINIIMNNTETSLATGEGDDYALYRGNIDTRFLLLPYDLDSLWGRGNTPTPPSDGIWKMISSKVPVIERFMKTPEFTPIYFKWLKYYIDTVFSPQKINPVIDSVLGPYLPKQVIDNMKAYNSNRVAYISTLIPDKFSVNSTLTLSNNIPTTADKTISLTGTANAILTTTVKVNGLSANYVPWQGSWSISNLTLQPGLNRIMIEAIDSSGNIVNSTNYIVWYNTGHYTQITSPISSNTVWSSNNSPYYISSQNFYIGQGATLIIEPGTTVYLGPGVNLTVANGGRLLAEGSPTSPIIFTRLPSTSDRWGGIIINGSTDSPETRISYAHIEFNGTTAIHSAGGTVFLDHLTFGSTDHQYLSLDNSSFIVSYCIFPDPSAKFEPVHGTGGIKQNGHGVFIRNFFGKPSGYNDVVDFTGGNRPNQPIIHFIDNVFTGASDDVLDLDGTDAWIEGNIFMHVHKNGSPDSSSAVSGGNDGANTSEITIIGNIIYDCDHAATAKQGNFYTLINNTIVHQSHLGGEDSEGAVINLSDEGTTEGKGFYLEANIIIDAEKLTRGLSSGIVTFTNNLMPFEWTGQGGGNSTNPPQLMYIPKIEETYFKSWQEAQVFWHWFSLRPTSPAIAKGPNKSNIGWIPMGVTISGVPQGTNNLTDAIIHVGSCFNDRSILQAGFPVGSGYTHYKWRLNSGAWSIETPINQPIVLTNLTNGEYILEVSGKRDSGLYQDDPIFGVDASPTISKWIVDTNWTDPNLDLPTIRINEVLADNSKILIGNTTPDLIEILNYGSNVVDLSGIGITDDPNQPYKFSFPTGTTINPGEFMILVCGNTQVPQFLNLGFNLNKNGDSVYIFDTPQKNSRLLDSVLFGYQITDFSIGRFAKDCWALCVPTFGQDNIAANTANPDAVKINEWLTDALFTTSSDFIELYNPQNEPVEISGFYLTDAAGSLNKFQIPPLSFIAQKGFALLYADGQPNLGKDHLNFKLASDVGLIRLSAPDLSLVDAVAYGPQQTDLSQGRSPNGSDKIVTFDQPTPGMSNPGSVDNEASITTIKIPLLNLNSSWKYNQSTNLDKINWMMPQFDDSSWPGGPGLLGVETASLPAPGLNTHLTLGRITYYFRSSFVVETNLSGFSINLTTVLDDGAIVYLNGYPVLTNRMPQGQISYSTLASSTVDNAILEYFSIPPDHIIPGTNIVAVEVHQASANSSDIVWGMALDAIKTVTNYSGSLQTAVVLNEVCVIPASNSMPPFIELYNPTQEPILLDNLSLSDDLAFPQKWVFPTNALIGPDQFYVVYCNPNLPPDQSNAPIALRAEGSTIYLFYNTGLNCTLIDSIQFGHQPKGYSIGRVPDGSGRWQLTVITPEQNNLSAALGNQANLKINEWMADPASGSDWLELYNPESRPVALSGLALSDDPANYSLSPIHPLSFIGVGDDAYVLFLADSNIKAGANHVNFALKKSGEYIILSAINGSVIDYVEFPAQLTGVSQGRFPDGSSNIVSFITSQSPDKSNFMELTNVLINEILANPGTNAEQAIELWNPNLEPINISGWYLSDSPENFKKFKIPQNTILEPNSFVVFYEYQFNSTNGIPFRLNPFRGGTLILSEADASGTLTGYRHVINYDAYESNLSIGNYLTTAGFDFTALQYPTFGVNNPGSVEDFRLGTGQTNAPPVVGPVVITEIMYKPILNGIEIPDLEFIEINNIADYPVKLSNSNSPPNGWILTNAVYFEFPPETILQPGQCLIVTGFDPNNPVKLSNFLATFQIKSNTIILGPWSGRLNNSEETIELRKPIFIPQTNNSPVLSYTIQDKVRYRSSAPWPTLNNDLLSLQKIEPQKYGNDPANWAARPPTPGSTQTNPNPGEDSDNDGLPDQWEFSFFGSLVYNQFDDPDHDGFTNLQEFLAGTNPKDPTDCLSIVYFKHSKNSMTLQFKGIKGKSYRVEASNDLINWQTLTNINPNEQSAGLQTVTEEIFSNTPSRFYRIILQN